MKTITLAFIASLLSTQRWTHAQHIERLDAYVGVREEYDSESDSLNSIEFVCHFGCSSLESSFEDLSILYIEGWSYNKNDVSSFETSIDGIDFPLKFNFNVIDDDGNHVEINHLIKIIPVKFKSIDYSQIFAEILDVEILDLEDFSTIMNVIELKNDDQPNVRFNGELLASVESENRSGRSIELNIYRTSSGKLVCQKIGKTSREGESFRYSLCVCETQDQVKQFFGFSSLAKDLYQAAQIDCAIDLD